MCATTHSYVCHDSFICVTWLIHMCAVTHSYVWRDSILWLIHVWNDVWLAPVTLQHSATCCNTLQHAAMHLWSFGFCATVSGKGVVLASKMTLLPPLAPFPLGWGMSHINKSCRTFTWGMSYLNESCYEYEWDMAYIWKRRCSGGSDDSTCSSLTLSSEMRHVTRK